MPNNVIGIGLQWLTQALGLQQPQVTSQLSTSDVTPVFDVLQGGLPYAQIVQKIYGLSPSPDDTAVLIPHGDMGFQHVVIALGIDPALTAADRRAFLQLIPPGGAIVGGPVVWVTSLLLDFAGNTPRGLNDFANPPRWIPPGYGLSLNIPMVGADQVDGIFIAYKIPAGFDLAPRGA